MIDFYELKIAIKKRLLNSKANLEESSKSEKTPHGKEFQLYWFLLTHEPMGIREIQKSLNIRSPSSVAFQINKLVKKGIVSKSENDKYYIKEEVKTGILSFYMRFGYRMIPRFSIYLCIYLVGLFGFLLAMILEGDRFILNQTNIIFFLYLIFSSGVFIFESIRIWKMKPEL